MNHPQKQTKHVRTVIILILATVLIGVTGFLLYKNIAEKESSVQNSTTNTQPAKETPIAETPIYTLDDAVSDINTVLREKTCISNSVTKDQFKTVENSAQFQYEGGVSKTTKGLSYAYVQYGCGSQGSVALLKRTNNKWVLVSNDARIHPMCDAVKGQDFPVSIIDKCYVDDRSSDPTDINLLQ